MALVYFNSLERQPLNRGCISPASRNQEILEKSTFSPRFLDFRRRRGDSFYSLERQALDRGCISPASRNREILEKSIFLQDF